MLCRVNPSKFAEKGNRLISLAEKWEDSSLSFGIDYLAYGLGVYNSICKVLLDPNAESRPFWYSLDHFDIVDPVLSKEWEACSDPGSDWTLIIGYHDLVSSLAHFNGLLERNRSDLQIFYKMKARVTI